MTQDEKDIQWFTGRGHWLIRKVAGTKDKFYLVCGNPPLHVQRIYGIL